MASSLQALSAAEYFFRPSSQRSSRIGINATAYAAKLPEGQTSVIILNKDALGDIDVEFDFGRGMNGAVETESFAQRHSTAVKRISQRQQRGAAQTGPLFPYRSSRDGITGNGDLSRWPAESEIQPVSAPPASPILSCAIVSEYFQFPGLLGRIFQALRDITSGRRSLTVDVRSTPNYPFLSPLRAIEPLGIQCRNLPISRPVTQQLAEKTKTIGTAPAKGPILTSGTMRHLRTLRTLLALDDVAQWPAFAPSCEVKSQPQVAGNRPPPESLPVSSVRECIWAISIGHLRFLAIVA